MTEETAGTPRGPCIVCGATGYSLSFGGPNICPSCDCGVDAEIAKLCREVAALTTQRDESLETVSEINERLLGWRTKAIAAEAQRDELQKRIGYTAVPVAEGEAQENAILRAGIQEAVRYLQGRVKDDVIGTATFPEESAVMKIRRAYVL